MNKLYTFTIALLMTCPCLGQDVPEPDFGRRPYFLSDGKLFDFEKEDAAMERKMKGMGYGGLEYYYSVNGAKSGTRFGQSSLPRIIIKMEDNSDPTEIFMLCTAEPKKASRRFKAMKMGALGQVKETSSNRTKMTAKKLRDKVFELTIGQPLEKGEYALIPNSSEAAQKAVTTGASIFCFGVD